MCVAAHAYAVPLAAGLLAANGIVPAYDEPFRIGRGPRGADPEVAYGVAFANAAAEAPSGMHCYIPKHRTRSPWPIPKASVQR